MSQFRILDDNLVFKSATDITASSTDSEFPTSNLKKYIRSKVWRSSLKGNYVIDTTNNKIDFTDSSSTVVATLTSGAYTSDTLATEIKTQMDAASVDTFTVSKSGSTGKWTIASDGSTFSILWSSGANTATSVGSSIGFDTASDNTGALSYTGSNIAIHTEENLVFDFKTAEDIDSIALLFDSVEGSKFSSSAVIKIQANATNVWTSPAVSTTLTIDTVRDIATHFYSSAQSYRYWRLNIVDPANTNLYVEVSKLFIAAATQLTQGVEIGFKYQVQDQSKRRENDFGHRYSDIYPNRKLLNFDYKVLTNADLNTLEEIFLRVGNHTPIAVSLDSLETVFDKDQFFIYGYLRGSFDADQVFLSFFDTGLAIEEAM